MKQRYNQLVDSSHSESPELLAEVEDMLVRYLCYIYIVVDLNCEIYLFIP